MGGVDSAYGKHDEFNIRFTGAIRLQHVTQPSRNDHRIHRAFAFGEGSCVALRVMAGKGDRQRPSGVLPFLPMANVG